MGQECRRGFLGAPSHLMAPTSAVLSCDPLARDSLTQAPLSQGIS